MLQINISTQSTRLDYTLRKAQLNLQSTRPELRMETTPTRVEISHPPGELTIDQTPCRYSIGIKNITDFARDNAALSRQIGLDNIAKIAEEGHQLTRIESKANAIANIAANSTRSETPSLTWAHIASPDIHYQANQVQFKVTDGKVNIAVQPGTVQGDYQPGSVEIRVIQFPSIKMSAVDVKA